MFWKKEKEVNHIIKIYFLGNTVLTLSVNEEGANKLRTSIHENNFRAASEIHNRFYINWENVSYFEYIQK